MSTLLACLTGFLLDLLWGDPVWLYHPVRLIGRGISGMERGIRRVCGASTEKQLWGGMLLAVVIPAVSAAVPLLLLTIVQRIHPGVRFVMESFFCYQLLAVKSLQQESMKVCKKLEEQDLEGARKAVSMIVGRDTEQLTEEGVIRAAVETVAENTSDGVVAPLLYLLIGGPAFGFFYKAVNTMDSMVGYKNERYLYIGRAAAKLDDLMNYIPARISAVLMVLTAFLTKMDGRQAWYIFRRDRYRHASPNSAQTEAACAGALGIQLGGNAYYFGKLHDKETIGDTGRKTEAADIRRANVLLYGTAVLAMVLFGGCKYAVLLAAGIG